VSCGTKLVADGALIQQQQPPQAQQQQQQQPMAEENYATAPGARQPHQQRQQAAPQNTPPAPGSRRGGMPLGIGIAIAGFILCASAGGTFFFLTKPPENERLLNEGRHQIQLGQYAFAVKTLSEAVKVRPNDAKAQLALARAYVGVDQVDKAWECITLAQQLGTGVLTEPELASELAKYYRQRNKYDKAAELLRPLASANVPGKRAELADLDAAWGDEAIRSGNYKQAMRCWEEVKELHDGTRFMEADSRLATIYQKVGDEMALKGDEEEALKYYAKLNVSAPSSSSFERTAELYEKQGKYALAIDQLERASKLSADNPVLTHKLSSLYMKRGKELLDAGEADSGYGWLQKAESLDPRLKAPMATVRNIHMQVDGTNGTVHLNGEVWNPRQQALNSLTLRAELYDSKVGKALWTKETHVIDEFVPPLPSREARPFDMLATAEFEPKTSEMRLFLNGALYKTYPLTKRSSVKAPMTAVTAAGADGKIQLRPRLAPITTPPVEAPGAHDGAPTPAPNAVNTPTAVPPVAPGTAGIFPPNPGGSSEEKTLKDLD
jgi:tetratricopeptide (TPR) repeat protein